MQLSSLPPSAPLHSSSIRLERNGIKGANNFTRRHRDSRPGRCRRHATQRSGLERAARCVPSVVGICCCRLFVFIHAVLRLLRRRCRHEVCLCQHCFCPTLPFVSIASAQRCLLSALLLPNVALLAASSCSRILQLLLSSRTTASPALCRNCVPESCGVPVYKA